MIKTRLFIFMLPALVISLACQKEKKKAPVPCAADFSINQNAPVKRDSMKLRREFAIVRHTTCDGKTSTRRVTVKEPKDAYSLHAQTLPASSGDYSVEAYNRTTCNSATIKSRKASDTRMEIQFHTSRGTRRTLAKKNTDNYIDYEFRRCLKRDAAGLCTSSEVAERGTVILFIEYSESEQPGITDTRADCPPAQ